MNYTYSNLPQSQRNLMMQYGDTQKRVMGEHNDAMTRMNAGMHEPGRYNVLHGAANRPGLTAGQPIMTSMRFGGFREKGGPVTPGKAYVVGEKRPELFVPDVPGEIVPMYESMGGSSRLTPKFQDIFVNTQPRISTAEQLLQAARERLMNAGSAARMKMREQEEQGVRPYVPADPVSASFEIARKTGESGIPLPRQAVSPTQLQQRPTGGVIASYGPNERVVTGNRGAGSTVVPTGPRKPATFDGMSKEQFFGQAASRQGADNKYARAEKTGKVDELGNPKFTSKAIPKGNTATSERIYEAMKKGGAKGKEKKKD